MAPTKGKNAAVARKAHPVKEDRKLKRKHEVESIEALQKAIDALDPKAVSPATTKFSDLPLSQPTAAGLRDSHFETLTDIQARAIPAALRGADILGAAKTGSGKTLAFLVPVLEKLYRARWTEHDGLGALIISPTRELSAQIFAVLRKVGRHHGFSAGLVIGGKNLQEEAERVGRMNILVCTPGRMLQHLDQTAGLSVDNLQVLVLDEADRIMDMGFQAAVDALVEHLPPDRQTMLFSATQSRKVSDLARLSLRAPEYIAVHEAAAAATPAQLQQHYVVTPLPDKLDTLYGFLRTNLKSKMIVFLSSGKQVRFAFEAFRHLQPGIPLLHLHGRQKQVARLEILSRFAKAQHACLFATDVVARGVDIPLVDWVVQVDCPEDADTYIHRSGRTARYERAGKAILFLDPSEEGGMVRRLAQKKVPIVKVNVREKKRTSIRDQLQNMCFQHHDIKYLAQKAFVSYVRSIHLQHDKDVFQLDRLDLEGYARSLGLAGAPQIRFRPGEDLKKLKNASRALLSSDSEDEEAEAEAGAEGDGTTTAARRKKDEVRTKAQRMFERTNQDVLTQHYQNMVAEGGNDDGGDEAEKAADFFSAKRVMDDDALLAAATGAGAGAGGAAGQAPKILRLGGERELVVDSKRREKMLKSKKQLLKFRGTGSKIVFDDDGHGHALYELQDEAAFRAQGDAEDQRRQFVQQEAGRVQAADGDDKALAKAKQQEKRLKRKLREREERGAPSAASTAGPQVTVGGSGDDDDDDDGLALLRSLPLAGGGGGGGGVGGGDDDDDSDDRDAASPPPKKKKWFQTDDSGDDDDGSHHKKKKTKTGKEHKKRKVIEVDDMPENLADLEALATGLLDA